VTYVALFLALFVFVGIIRMSGVANRSVDALQATRQSVAVIASRDLSDGEKEFRIRKAARFMLRALASIAVWSAIAIVFAVGIVAAGGLIDLYRFDHAVVVAGSWPFIVIASATMTAVWIALTRYGSK
jgi:hypothetical protein